MEKERILIVDDDPSIREIITRLVNEMGYEGVKAGNGREAMDLLRQSSFLLMITDMRMPEMDGFELTRSTRAEFPILPVICMTAHGASYTYTDVVRYGATDYITKPFTLMS
jgi:DNA-binding NtrC family response regulator